MMPFSLFLALKYMRPKRSFVSVVTLISVVGVLLGVSILVIVLSVMTGFDEMWRDKILSFKPHLTVVSNYGAIDDSEEMCRQIESVEGVTGVAPVIMTRALIKSEGRVSAPVVVGIDDSGLAPILYRGPGRSLWSPAGPGHRRTDRRADLAGMCPGSRLALAAGDAYPGRRSRRRLDAGTAGPDGRDQRGPSGDGSRKGCRSSWGRP